MGTKKLLAAYDVEHAEARPGELLVPWMEGGRLGLIGMKSGRIYSYGTVVHVGREVSEQDVFARLVDAGRHFADLDQGMAIIGRYVRLMPDKKIGSVVRLADQDQGAGDFELESIKVERTSKSRLP